MVYPLACEMNVFSIDLKLLPLGRNPFEDPKSDGRIGLGSSAMTGLDDYLPLFP